MRSENRILYRTILLLLLFLLQAACVTDRIGRKVAPGELADGFYEGEFSSFPNIAHVLVVIEDGRIKDVELLDHGGSWIGHRADVDVPIRIIVQQSTSVDAVTGATNSSHVIMNAVEEALKKARGEIQDPNR